MKQLILITTLLLSMLNTTNARTVKQLSDSLHTLFTQLFPADEPGAAVLIMQGNKVLFDQGFGIADIQSKEPITGNTSFNIASVSKQFTATAILQLAGQGKLSLDDPVSKYYPEFKGAFWKNIQLKHLLSHSSGIADKRKGYTRQQKIYADDTMAVEFMKDLDVVHFAPGEQYEYVNPTFVLLGFIVEKVSGQPFVEYVQQHIFTPAGMTHTQYFDRDHQDLIPHMAHGYEYGDVKNMSEERSARTDSSQKNWYEDDFGEETFFATRPDGGIYTSTHDFIHWEKALRTGKVLDKEWLTLAHTPHTLVTGSKFSDYQNRPNTWYGYGWFIEPKLPNAPLKIYHTGDNGGFKALVARYPETKTLVLIFANRTDWDRYAVMQRIEKWLNL